MDPQYKPGDVVNGYLLTEQPDGSQAWLPVPANHRYLPGDTTNGYRLTAQPDGTEAWLPIASGQQFEPKPTNSATGYLPTEQLNRAGGVAPKAPKSPQRQWGRGHWITIGSVLGVLALIILIGTLNERTSSEPGPAAEESSAVEEVEATPNAEPEPEPEMVTVPPGLVGMTANDAYNALAAVGLMAEYDGEATAKVLSVSPNAAEVEVDSIITLTVEQPPVLTISQQNAVDQGRSYLSYAGFSRSGLIGQLEYEGYSTEDATFAADYIAPDWNAEAAESAKSYLDYSSFSRQGLIDQLIYEGFTPEQAEFGVAANGY